MVSVFIENLGFYDNFYRLSISLTHREKPGIFWNGIARVESRNREAIAPH